MNNKTATIIIGLILIVGAFFVGRSSGAASAKATAAKANQGSYAGFSRSGMAGRFGGAGSATIGQIASIGSNSITVSIPNQGGSKVVLYAPSTSIMKIITGSMTDLTVGANVVVTGTTNSDGSITATGIQLRPASAQSSATTTGQGSNAPMIPANQ